MYIRTYLLIYICERIAEYCSSFQTLAYRAIIRLLEDLVFFVICKETSGTQRPVALTEDGTPDRDRQKLIREQEVLKEVRAEGEGEVVFFYSKRSFLLHIVFVDYENTVVLCACDFVRCSA